MVSSNARNYSTHKEQTTFFTTKPICIAMRTTHPALNRTKTIGMVILLIHLAFMIPQIEASWMHWLGVISIEMPLRNKLSILVCLVAMCCCCCCRQPTSIKCVLFAVCAAKPSQKQRLHLLSCNRSCTIIISTWNCTFAWAMLSNTLQCTFQTVHMFFVPHRMDVACNPEKEN